MTIIESAVRECYSGAAKAREANPCCPVEHNPPYLQTIPDEIVEKDYGCGDPSQHVDSGKSSSTWARVVARLATSPPKSLVAEGKIIGRRHER